jgi:hypothetical protein
MAKNKLAKHKYMDKLLQWIFLFCTFIGLWLFMNNVISPLFIMLASITVWIIPIIIGWFYLDKTKSTKTILFISTAMFLFICVYQVNKYRVVSSTPSFEDHKTIVINKLTGFITDGKSLQDKYLLKGSSIESANNEYLEWSTKVLNYIQDNVNFKCIGVDSANRFIDDGDVSGEGFLFNKAIGNSVTISGELLVMYRHVENRKEVIREIIKEIRACR